MSQKERFFLVSLPLCPWHRVYPCVRVCLGRLKGNESETPAPDVHL